MGIVHVQRVGSAVSTAAATTLSIVVPAGGVGLGSKLLVAFLTNSDNSDALPTCADSKGNAYATDHDAFHPTNGNKRLTCFSANITTALVNGDTITVTSPSLNRRAMDAREVSGLGQSMDRKASADSAAAPSATPSSGATAVRQYAHEFLWGVVAWGNALTDTAMVAGAGYLDAQTAEAGTGGTWRELATEYQIVAVAGTDLANGTLAGNRGWIAAVLTYPDAADVPKSNAETSVADLANLVTVS